MASLVGASPYCIPCENRSHWIEVMLVDEHNQPFKNTPGTLTDASGAEFPIVAGTQAILITTLAPGPVEINLDNQKWLDEAQSRTPYLGDEDPQAVRRAAPGYQNAARQQRLATAGDLTETESDAPLPARHRAGQAGTLKLISDNSYLIEVRGFNYITLRLGIFFDGTCNNSYSAQWGKQQLDNEYHRWSSRYKSACEAVAKRKGIPVDTVHPKDLPESCFNYPDKDKFHFFWQEDEATDGSAANELTNIQKLHDRYLLNKFDKEGTTFFHPEYITGIGTGNETEIEPADESLVGMGCGTGKYGVAAKVSTAIEQLSQSLEEITKAIDEETTDCDGIKKLTFDVFGFSRGAAAARHFINVLLDGDSGEFATNITSECQQHQLPLAINFDWSKNTHCEVSFAGLFDTVAAIADIKGLDFSAHNSDNGAIRLWLDPSRVKQAVHLVADSTTEYRHNFSLNQLNTASHFQEIALFGAHSDLGGGYHARHSFREQGDDYLLPLLEAKCLDRHTRQINRWNHKQVQQQIEAELLETQQKTEAQGWKGADYTLATQKINGGRGGELLMGELHLKRVVEGELSRLYLRLMYGFAEFHGVPLDDKAGSIWGDERFYYYTIPEMINGLPFNALCKDTLAAAKQGQLYEALQSPKLRAQLMSANLIHHSADRGIANKPGLNPDRTAYLRTTHSVQEGD